MLKAQDGRADAVQMLRYFADKLGPRTVSSQTALALLEQPLPQLANLQALATAYPDFGLLPNLLSRELAEAKKANSSPPAIFLNHSI